MSVSWSKEAACYVWSCIFGHYGFDHESEREATDAFLAHDCVVS